MLLGVIVSNRYDRANMEAIHYLECEESEEETKTEVCEFILAWLAALSSEASFLLNIWNHQRHVIYRYFVYLLA